MIEPQSVQAGESAVSNTTGAWPAASRSARSFASTPCATIFSPSSSPFATVSCFAETVSPPTGMLAAALLAVLAHVDEFGRTLLKPLGAPAGKIEAFVETPFKLDNGKSSRPWWEQALI